MRVEVFLTFKCIWSHVGVGGLRSPHLILSSVCSICHCYDKVFKIIL